MHKVSNTPFFSIVMPLYNKEKEVERAIQSVLAQTFQNFELIVVDDGSTDRGPDIVSGLKDARIQMIRQENAGVSAARNRGIQEAKADLIAFLDADDEWLPEFLETIMKLKLKYSYCKVFATGFLYYDEECNYRKPILRGLAKEFSEGILTDYFDIASQSDPPLCSSAVAIFKAAILDVGGFPTGITSGEDLLTWTRLAVKYDIAYSIHPYAIFWQPWSSKHNHRRIPVIPDYVGQDLYKIATEANYKYSASLKQYIALWHIMRASIFIQYAYPRDSYYNDIKRAIKYSGLSFKLMIFILLSLLPAPFASWIFSKMMEFKRNFNKQSASNG